MWLAPQASAAIGALLFASFAAAANSSLAFSPPSYPSPWGKGDGDWSAAYVKARAFVSQLTLLEKVNLTTGVGWEGERCVGNTGAIPRLNWPALCLQDSPLGVRLADYVSAFPAGINAAATWSRELANARGAAMGSEHRDKGVDVQLGPVAGPLGRVPAGGRGWEGFSPDPVLTGVMIAETIQGIQSAGVIACAKHYIVNEQEHFRQMGESQDHGFNITESLSSNVDDTTMHELYLWPFADAVRAGVASIMCSYNQVNNSYACDNSYVLNHLLKNELDFQGFVVSDWAAQHSGVSSALAGLDMTMPGDTSFDSTFTFWGTNLTLAVLNGTVPEWRIDDMATRIMAAYFKVGRDENRVPPNFSAWTKDTVGFQHAFAETNLRVINEHVDVRADHAALIREIGSASTVLLKNTGALPLSGKEKLTALFGEDAGDDAYGVNGCSNRGCNNGTLAMGWGSGVAEFPYLVSPATAIQNEVLSNGGTFSAITDNWAYDSGQEQIQNLAKHSSVSIVFVNADSGEGFIIIDGNAGDRKNLTVWNGGDHLIQNVSAVCNNTIVVMHTVGVVMVNEWYSNPNITAIIWAGLPGQESGNSLTDILYGKVNPGGKLPFSIAAAPDDYGVSILDEPNGATIFDAPQQDFTEGVFIDYRALDKAGKKPIYEFGFGLSYTTFAYSNLQVSPAGAGPYIPTTGTTTAAPVLGNFSTDLTQYLFPEEIERVYGYIYPYINFTDAATSNNDPGRYGQTAAQFTPAHSTDSSPQPLLASGGAPGGNPGLYDVLYHVSATITNTGEVAGDEVAQLYVSLGGANDPKVALRGFDRITIAPGASATFTVDLTRRDVSNWDVVSQNWVVTSSPKTVWVGASSKILPLSAPLPALQHY